MPFLWIAIVRQKIGDLASRIRNTDLDYFLIFAFQSAPLLEKLFRA